MSQPVYIFNVKCKQPIVTKVIHNTKIGINFNLMINITHKTSIMLQTLYILNPKWKQQIHTKVMYIIKIGTFSLFITFTHRTGIYTTFKRNVYH